MIRYIIAASLSATGLGDPGIPGFAVARHSTHPYESPYIELWTNKDEVYRRGEQVRVYFRTGADTYVTIFRVDTDGRVEVLFPHEPWEDNYARGGRQYQVETHRNSYSFVVDDYPGQGYLFGVATADPFNYGELVRGDHWDYRVIADEGRIVGDPYVALMDLIDQIVPPNYAEYAYDVLPYYVDRHYDYPRFLCYDCHAYAPYSYWDPYRYSCVRFRIIIYDDPYYYPARRYAGTRVVYQRPARINPRYVFRPRSVADPYVVHTQERPADGVRRRRVSESDRRGVTSRDLGGVGRIPAPSVSRRRRAQEPRPEAAPLDVNRRRQPQPLQRARQYRRADTSRIQPAERPTRRPAPYLQEVRPDTRRVAPPGRVQPPTRRATPRTGRTPPETLRRAPQVQRRARVTQEAQPQPRARPEPRRTSRVRLRPTVERRSPRSQPRRVNPRRRGSPQGQPQPAEARRAQPQRTTRRSAEPRRRPSGSRVRP